MVNSNVNDDNNANQPWKVVFIAIFAPIFGGCVPILWREIGRRDRSLAFYASALLPTYGYKSRHASL